VQGKTIAVLGLTFKPNTDDMRDAPSLVILPALEAQGATIKAFDPAGMEEARRLMPGVEMAADPYACNGRRRCTRDHHRMGSVPRARP